MHTEQQIMGEPVTQSMEIPFKDGFLGLGQKKIARCSFSIPKDHFYVGEQIPLSVSIDNTNVKRKIDFT